MAPEVPPQGRSQSSTLALGAVVVLAACITLGLHGGTPAEFTTEQLGSLRLVASRLRFGHHCPGSTGDGASQQRDNDGQSREDPSVRVPSSASSPAGEARRASSSTRPETRGALTDSELSSLGWAWDVGAADSRDAFVLCHVRPPPDLDTGDAPPSGSHSSEHTDPATWYDEGDDVQKRSHRLRSYLAAPRAAWDVPSGGSHPLSQAAGDWQRGQLAQFRRAMAAAAQSVDTNEPAQTGPSVFRVIPLANGSIDRLHPRAYLWPLPDLLPLPALVVGGGAASRPGHQGARRAMMAYLRVKAAAAGGRPRTTLDGAGASSSSPVTRRLLRHLASLPLSEALATVDPSLRMTTPSVDVQSSVKAESDASFQPWLAPTVRIVVTRSTLNTLSLPELRLLSRAIRSTCGDVQSSQAAADWLGAVIATEALIEDGCGIAVEQEQVMRLRDVDERKLMGGIQQRRLTPTNGQSGGKQAGHSSVGTLGAHAAAGLHSRSTATSPRADNAVLPSHQLWDTRGSTSPMRIALLRTVTLRVEASDVRSLRHITAAEGSRERERRSLTEQHVSQLLGIIRSAVPPPLRGNKHSDSEGGDLSRLLVETEARLQSLNLPAGANTGVDNSYAYAGQPLPWEGQEESFLLIIDADVSSSLAPSARIDNATYAALFSVLFPGNERESSRVPQKDPSVDVANASLSAATVWGMVRGLQTLSQTLQSWGSASHHSGFDNRNDAAALLLALASNESLLTFSSSIAALSTQLSPSCAVLKLRGIAASSDRSSLVRERILDPGRPLPVSLPLTIADTPWRAWRGLSIDTARHYIPLPTLYRFVDTLAASRASVLHWHLADAQSWPLALHSFPHLASSSAWGNGTFVYTRSDVTALVRYAADRGIRVVPEIDMPSHTRGLGNSDATRHALVRCDRVAGGSLHDYDKFALDPTSPVTYATAAVVLAELGSLFPDDQFHIGADEVVADCWASEPRLASWAAAHLPHIMAALASNRDWRHNPSYLSLLAHFLHTTHGLLAVLGKKGVSWADSHEMLTAAEGTIQRHSGKRQRSFRALWDVLTSSSAREEVHAAVVRVARSLSIMRRRRRAEGGAAPPSVTVKPSSLREKSASATTVPATRVPRVPSPSPTASMIDAVDHAFEPLLGPSSPSPTANCSTLGEDRCTGDSRGYHEHPLVEYGYSERTTIEAWKCWEAHGDTGLLQAAEDAYGSLDKGRQDNLQGHDNGGDSFDSPLGPFPSRPVLNAACTYMDYSPTWVEYARKWPLPETPRAWDRLSALVRKRWRRWAGDNDTSSSPPRLPLTLSSLLMVPWPYVGGEAAIWTEQMDGSNVLHRSLPRAVASLETFASQSLAIDRVARAAAAAGLDLVTTDARIPTGWAARSDDLRALAPQLHATSIRLLRFTVMQLWARGIGAATLAVYDMKGESAAVKQGDGGLSSLFSVDEPITSADAWPSFMRLTTNEHEESPFSNGAVPGIVQQVQRSPDDVPQPDVIHSTHMDKNVSLRFPCSTPACSLQFLVWNIDDGGGSGNPWRRAKASSGDPEGSEGVHGRGLGPNGPRWSSMSRFLADRANEYHVLALVEAVAWDIGTVKYRQLGDDGSTGPGQHNNATSAFARELVWQAQTESFRRRAASLGYAHAHLLTVSSGYHIALLSSSPIVPVLEERGGAMERGMLVADSHGVRWMVGHLHAHDPAARVREAVWVAHLGRTYTAAGLRVVWAGDSNSLSPLDAPCHTALGVPSWLGNPSTRPYLRKKFRVPGTGAGGFEDVEGPHDASTPAEVDYRPLAALLAPLPDIAPRTSLTGPFYDAVAPHGLQPGNDNNTRPVHGNQPTASLLGPAHGCPGTIPTSFATDDTGSVPVPPLRIDQVLINEHLVHSLSAAPAHAQAEGGSAHNAVCNVLRSDEIAGMSDHFPIGCFFKWR